MTELATPTRRRLPQQVVAFGLVGGVAGVCDYAVMIALRELLLVDSVAAALAGYVVGATISYLLNRRRTFRSTRPHGEAVWRFAVVNVAGFAATALLMTVGVRWLGMSYLIARLVTTATIFVMNFTSHRYWTFRVAES